MDLSTFLDDLCSQLVFATVGLEIQCRADPVVVSADKAIPVGLIVNELVTNAVKYAYDEGEPGLIEVALWQKGERAMVRVRDAGRGLPEGFDLETSRKSFGIRVILSLVRQLDAELTVESVPRGASFLLAFDPVTSS